MRRKDGRYYWKTALLRIAAWRHRSLQNRTSYKEELKARRKEYQTKLLSVELEFGPISLDFQSYFYFKDTSIFDDVYHKESGLPTRLKSEQSSNPLLAIYFSLVEWNARVAAGELSPEYVHTRTSSLIEMAKKSDLDLLYLYDEDYELFNLKAPWISGLTQALATSYFLRVYEFCKDESYLDAAKKCFRVCLENSQDHQLLIATPAGLEWLEEYPSSGGSYVLNGHMFGIIACAELAAVTQEPLYKLTAKQWIKSLIHHLPEYQYGSFLLHNKKQSKLSNIEYQGLYVGLFKHLHSLTKHPIFHELYSFYNAKINWEDFYRFYGMNQK